MICTHCGDRYAAGECPDCGQVLACCQDCHDELVHDRVGPPPVTRGGTRDVGSERQARYEGWGDK